MKLFNTDESASEKARSLKLIEKRVVNRTPFGVRHIRKFLPLALLFAAIIVVGITDTFQGFASFIAVLLVCATYSISNRIAPFLAAAVSSVAMIWWLSRGVADDEQAFISLILTLIFVWGAAAVVNYIHFLENEFVEQGWRLKLGLEAGNIGIFRWHLETGKIYGQGNLGDLFDLPAGATFHQDDLIRKVHPDDVEIVERIAKNAREHGDEYEAEFRIVTGAGSYRWIASRGILTSSGKSSRRFLTGANWDITHQKQQDDHIRNILDGVDAIALLLSPDGSVVSVNRFTLNLTNEKESALIGRKVWEIFDCDE